MQDSWIGRKIAQLESLNDPMAGRLLAAAKRGQLTGRVYHTRSGDRGQLVTELQSEQTYDYDRVFKAYQAELARLRGRGK